MKVKVNNDHIQYGVKRNCEKCPIALALQDEFPYHAIEVGDDGVTIGADYYDLPEIAQDFISDFDDGMSVQPFEFMLDMETKKTAAEAAG